MTPPLDQSLSALAREAIELAGRATAGPWERDPCEYPSMQVIAHGNEVVVYHRRHERQVDGRVVPNHAFIAHARNSIERISRGYLEAVEELDAKTATSNDLARAIDQFCAWICEECLEYDAGLPADVSPAPKSIALSGAMDKLMEIISAMPIRASPSKPSEATDKEQA